jgi:GTP pyrophosphokinase
MASEDAELIVGLDFAFSLPAWFLDKQGTRTAHELWKRAEHEGELWLKACEPPFWGKPGKKRPDIPEHLRATDLVAGQQAGVLPKSIFQISGAGAVGTGSLRGMPHLVRLAEAGFSMWPIDEPSLPLVIEIYPRLLTGPVVKSRHKDRDAYLAREFPNLSREYRKKAAAKEDAFDAAVSALVMGRHAGSLAKLQQPDDAVLRREGAIWWPSASYLPGSRLQQALVYATALHGGQTRKGTEGIPYLGHLLGVCSLTLEAGGDEELAIAALLHDAPEDQGGRETLAEIRDKFGNRVASIVEACTDTFEEPKPDWRPRKERHLEHLAAASPDILLVACADKLYNARAILQDYRRVGNIVFDRFTASKEETFWYYRSLADAFEKSKLESWLVAELARTVGELERVARRD